MRQAKVLYKEHLAGILTETDEGQFIFQYDEEYVTEFPNRFLTFSMPVRPQPYIDKNLFSFFEGLIPEGWLLNIASQNWKLNPRDRMGLLMACCQNCIGAISVVPIPQEDDN